MIAIADSGSSKTEWRILVQNEIVQTRTLGLNPYHLSSEDIINELREDLLPKLQSLAVEPGQIDQVFFYGAGVSKGAEAEKLKLILEKFFPHCVAEVNDDLLAVARGLCGADAGIACILGTGANSGYYDGQSITWKVEALGYILGDEGSGSWLGKRLLADYIRDKVPGEIRHYLEKRFELTRMSVLDHVYRQPSPAGYLAGFSKFIFQHIGDRYLYQLVYSGFDHFFTENICRYKNYETTPVNFSGSVAFYYGNILREVAADRKVNVRHIVEGPIAGLALYHQNN